VLNRNFKATKKGKKWVSDITYLQTTQGWLYLTIILDLFDRKIIGWSLSDDLSTDSTIIPAWFMATKNRSISKSLVFHSDRGVQYASKASTLEKEKENPLEISVEEYKKLDQTHVQLIDVRERVEVQKQNLGALHIPLKEIKR